MSFWELALILQYIHIFRAFISSLWSRRFKHCTSFWNEKVILLYIDYFELVSLLLYHVSTSVSSALIQSEIFRWGTLINKHFFELVSLFFTTSVHLFRWPPSIFFTLLEPIIYVYSQITLCLQYASGYEKDHVHDYQYR